MRWGMESPLKYFAELRDPRVERTREHLLEEILLLAIAAVLSGAGSWNEIEDYGKAKRAWFKGFLQLPGGIPSHDTLNRVMSALDPAEMEKGLADWVVSIAKLTSGEVVAIDGKTLCGTPEAGKKTLVHMVSAWASANNLVLAQRKVDDKSNEITAIPKLLDALELSRLGRRSVAGGAGLYFFPPATDKLIIGHINTCDVVSREAA